MKEYRWWLDPGRMVMIVLFYCVIFPLDDLYRWLKGKL